MHIWSWVFMLHKTSLPMRPFIELGKQNCIRNWHSKLFEVTNEIVTVATMFREINVDTNWVVKVFVLKCLFQTSNQSLKVWNFKCWQLKYGFLILWFILAGPIIFLNAFTFSEIVTIFNVNLNKITKYILQVQRLFLWHKTFLDASWQHQNILYFLSVSLCLFGLFNLLYGFKGSGIWRLCAASFSKCGERYQRSSLKELTKCSTSSKSFFHMPVINNWKVKIVLYNSQYFRIIKVILKLCFTSTEKYFSTLNTSPPLPHLPTNKVLCGLASNSNIK